MRISIHMEVGSNGSCIDTCCLEGSPTPSPVESPSDALRRREPFAD